MNDYLTEQMEELNLTAASESFTKLFPGYQIDMNSLFNLILEGQAGEAFKMITQAVKEGFAGDLAGMKTLLVRSVSFLHCCLISRMFWRRGIQEEQDSICCI